MEDTEDLEGNHLGNFHKNKAKFDAMPFDLDIEVQGHLKLFFGIHKI